MIVTDYDVDINLTKTYCFANSEPTNDPKRNTPLKSILKHYIPFIP